jgi:hypothetical protein
MARHIKQTIFVHNPHSFQSSRNHHHHARIPENNRTDGKSTNQSLDNLSGTGDRKSKRSRTAALAALTPSTVSSSLTSTPTSNLSLSTSTPKSNFTNVSSKTLTSNGLLSNTAQTPLYLGDLSGTPSTPVKTSSNLKKPAYSVNFCNSSDTLAECLKYVNNPDDVPKDQESQLRFLLEQYKTNDVRTAFCQLIGKVGGLAVTAFHPLPIQKN